MTKESKYSSMYFNFFVLIPFVILFADRKYLAFLDRPTVTRVKGYGREIGRAREGGRLKLARGINIK